MAPIPLPLWPSSVVLCGPSLVHLWPSPCPSVAVHNHVTLEESDRVTRIIPVPSFCGTVLPGTSAPPVRICSPWTVFRHRPLLTPATVVSCLYAFRTLFSRGYGGLDYYRIWARWKPNKIRGFSGPNCVRFAPASCPAYDGKIKNHLKAVRFQMV